MAYLLYTLRECRWGLVRGARSYAVSVLTMAAVLLAVGVVLLGFRSLDTLIALVRDQAQITVYLAEKGNPGETAAALRTLPGVTGVRLVTREEALARLRQSLGRDAFLLEALEGFNPLADSLEVAVVPEQAPAVADAAASLPGVERVRDNRDLLDRLVRVTRFVRGAGGAFSAALLGIGLMVAANTARLAVQARRSEIELRVLLGAPRWFVKAPFLLEGLAVGALAALIAGAGLGALYPALHRYAAAALPFVPLLAPAAVLPSLAATLLALGALSSLAGSWLGATFRQ